ncbi:hypothetical protein K0504_11370 [Neiella marina]|uniref:Right handed beta helix domain-containing protein n=1 Tax=Neiella holothuriorum TaxID=2870530 RepID=A0ABS7EH28_9GAMM|nr:hypothetical protein [Neiella holothuriorum]MBW8191638.1 hypothetical protein [Neiella holothuriorum]
MVNQLRQLIVKMINLFLLGLSFGLGFFAVALIAALFYKGDASVSKVANKAKQFAAVSSPFPTNNYELKNHQPSQLIPNSHAHLLTSNMQIKPPADYSVVDIKTSREFILALKKLKPKTAFYFADGIYQFKRGITINQPNIMLLSKSQHPSSVIFAGKGMIKLHKAINLINVNSSGFVLDGITLKKSPNHIIQIRSERQANFPIVRNCIIENGYEQLIKVSYDKRNKPNNFSHSGIVENCIFRYTEGIGPNYYIGGIDAHGIKNWQIRNNLFLDIASPGKRIAEHAIHIWNNSEGTIVEGNMIIDSDRGIGFGMFKQNQHSNIKFSHFGGIIKNNFIYHSSNADPFADSGIILEQSPYTKILNNHVFLEHNYDRAIEYRFNSTFDTVIEGNKTNKKIASRNGGGTSSMRGNSEQLSREKYANALAQHIERSNLPYFIEKEITTHLASTFAYKSNGL